MAGGPSMALSRDLRTLYEDGTGCGLSDRQLLETFLRERGTARAAAFEILMRRHGPMVLRVCRSALQDGHDAEDAFQATFLILARRGGSIRMRDSVESWLFGVASRVAARARVEASRRRTIEARGARPADPFATGSDESERNRRELGPIVQEEVARLPEKFRAAVVLCYWEDLTQEQAAERLGCPLGTVRSRVARARDLLRRRLVRRGVGPVATLAGAGLDLAPWVPGPCTVPDSWIAATVRTATTWLAPTEGAAAVVSASATALARSVLGRMSMMRAATCAVGLSLVVMGAAGAILASPQAGDDAARPRPRAARPSAQVERARQEPIRPARAPLPPYVIEPPDIISVSTLASLPGRPISGERLVRPDGKISLGFYGEVYVAGLTVRETKEKVVLHLRRYLTDEALGLLEVDPRTGDFRRDTGGQLIRRDAADTDRVTVDVIAYNSKFFYVQGAVAVAGRQPLKGNETVLDAINQAGGLNAEADHRKVVLYRPAPPGAQGIQRLPVNIDDITVGGDPTTNYQLMPGDRLVVPAKVKETLASGATGDDQPARGPAPGNRRPDQTAHDSPLEGIERCLDAVERKLDRVLDTLENRRP